MRSQGRYGIPQEYGGHGIGTEMHMDPWVANHGKPGRGPKLEADMCLAIEPMVNLGTDQTRVLSDDWTVVTQDGKASAHFEHSVAVTEEGPLVLTALDGGQRTVSRDISGKRRIWRFGHGIQSGDARF